MQISTNDVFRKENTAVITGASSGIGRRAAIECALKGMHVWMIDKDEDDLKRAKDTVLDKVGNAYLGQVRCEDERDFTLECFQHTANNNIV